MDYSILAEKMLLLRAQLSHLPAGEAVSDACGGEFFALSLLLAGAPSCPSALSRSMGVSSARIAALLKHLEQKGLVLRRTDEHDERRVNVSLTDAGRKLINERRREAIERVAAALRSLGEEDALEYIRLQQKMLDALSASDKQA
ncbi:MAG: winged helix DNA-binding protein [Oscillospiraceae bacterium]|nr:winged helix DNA-binding protein [Oscillospiraceae bacterium]